MDELARRLGQEDGHEDAQGALMPDDCSRVECILELLGTFFKHFFLSFQSLGQADFVKRQLNLLHQAQFESGELLTGLGYFCIRFGNSDIFAVLLPRFSVAELEEGLELIKAVQFGLEPADDKDNQKVEEVLEASNIAKQLREAFDNTTLNTQCLAHIDPDSVRTGIFRLLGEFEPRIRI